MDVNALKLKVTVCTLTSYSLFYEIWWSMEPKEQRFYLCPNTDCAVFLIYLFFNLCLKLLFILNSLHNPLQI